jgi:two-component system cell cycle response regulator DivK
MTRNVLVVEDNVFVAKMYSTCLAALKVKVRHAGTAEDALSLAESQVPDLVVMDLKLPRMSGLDLARHMRSSESLKDVPILAVTTLSVAGDGQEIRDAGCSGYLQKPIQIPTFIETVQSFLG